MLLAVAGLGEEELRWRTEALAAGEWTEFSSAERVAFSFTHKLTKKPWAIADHDIHHLVNVFGLVRTLDIIWHIAWCNYMTRVADAFQLPLESENVFADQ